MPNIKSAKKRVEVNERNRIKNKSAVSRMKTELKKYNTAIANADVEKAEQMLSNTMSIIDKTEKKGAIHKNSASRKKAIASKKLENLKSAQNK